MLRESEHERADVCGLNELVSGVEGLQILQEKQGQEINKKGCVAEHAVLGAKVNSSLSNVN